MTLGPSVAIDIEMLDHLVHIVFLVAGLAVKSEFTEQYGTKLLLAVQREEHLCVCWAAGI